MRVYELDNTLDCIRGYGHSFSTPYVLVMPLREAGEICGMRITGKHTRNSVANTELYEAERKALSSMLFAVNKQVLTYGMVYAGSG